MKGFPMKMGERTPKRRDLERVFSWLRCELPFMRVSTEPKNAIIHYTRTAGFIVEI
jgi:hypothetical protein